MEIMALAGVDLVIIDNEHYPFDEETMIDLVRAADVRGMACAVRVPNAEPTRIAQIMDYGVDGILVPSVDSYEEAMQLVNAVKYAPVGDGLLPHHPGGGVWLWANPPRSMRSLPTSTPSSWYRSKPRRAWPIWTASSPSRRSTALTTAPPDLAASYGKPGHNDDPEVQRVVRDIIDRARAAGKNVGEMAYTPEAVRALLERGVRHVSHRFRPADHRRRLQGTAGSGLSLKEATAC